MSLNGNVGIGVALVVGMALGYAAQPDAQGQGTEAVRSFTFKGTPNGMVTLSMSTSTDTPVVESAAIDVILTRDRLYFTSIGVVNGARKIGVPVPTP
jgi:hypothetical protein